MKMGEFLNIRKWSEAWHLNAYKDIIMFYYFINIGFKIFPSCKRKHLLGDVYTETIFLSGYYLKIIVK